MIVKSSWTLVSSSNGYTCLDNQISMASISCIMHPYYLMHINGELKVVW